MKMRVLRVGGVVSPRTIAISYSYSVSDSESSFEVNSVAFSGDLDHAFLFSRFGERWYHSFGIFSK